MTCIAAYLIDIIERLRRAVANHAAAQETPVQVTWLGDRAFTPIVPPPLFPPIPTPTWLLLHARLARLATRVQSLFARWQAGTLKPPRPAPASPRAPRTAKPYPRLPRARGWINARIQAAAPCAGLLESFLHHQPDTARFVAEVPRAARLLRPLCHALAINPPACMALPARPARVRPARPPRPKPEPFTRPLPAYVRAAARAWRKYDR